jgi:hypothetical protein
LPLCPDTAPVSGQSGALLDRRLDSASLGRDYFSGLLVVPPAEGERVIGWTGRHPAIWHGLPSATVNGV